MFNEIKVMEYGQFDPILPLTARGTLTFSQYVIESTLVLVGKYT